MERTTLKEAYEKAKSLKPNITSCIEFEDYFIFADEKDNDKDGGDGACVILKETGEAVNFLEILKMPSELKGEIDIKNIEQ